MAIHRQNEDLMSRFKAERIEREGESLVALRDSETGAEALVWPDLGNNCFAARVPDPLNPDALVELLLAPPSLEDLRREPSHWGIPLLWPFPSHMPGGAYTFQGNKGRFQRQGHGFVLHKPWSVSAMQSGDAVALTTSVFDSADHSETLEEYPFPYRVEAEYALDSNGLRLTLRVVNTGDGQLPFGYGAHPYFQLPLGPAGDRSACRIRVPAARRWSGQALRAVSEGVVAPWEELCPRIAPELDLRSALPLREKLFDGVWTDLTLTCGLVECVAEDPANGVAAVMRATSNHTNVTVFTPAWASSVCFEPWTCPPNAFNLATHGVPGHGLTVLQPGEEWAGTMWLSLEPLGAH